MNRILFTLMAVFAGFIGFGQDTLKDIPPLNRGMFSSEKQVSLRVGGGLQKSFYTELGIALHKCNYSDVGFFSNDLYTSIEWTPNRQQNIYGLKVGYEANSFIFLLNAGLEFKYQTDFTESDFVITPKIGFGLFGDANLFYGYHISTNKNPFAELIGHHQISIVFNINRHFLQY